MTTKPADDIVTDIQTRLAQIQTDTSPENIRGLMEKMLPEFLQGLQPDDPIVRKFQHSAPDNKLAGSKFARWGLDVADIEFAYDLLKSARSTGLSNEGPSEELENAFKAVSEASYISDEEIRAMDKKALDGVFPRIRKQGIRGFDRLAGVESAVRAMDTAESGYGQQLVGSQYVRDIWEGARYESRVAALIDTFEMTDPTALLPVEVDIPEMIFVGENTANNSSAYATVKTGSNRIQVDAKKFVIHQMWSGELEEDSIIGFVQYLRRQAQIAIAHYTDSVVLNGDTTNAATGNINLDDADPADTKHYLAFDGIRHAALVDNTGNAVDAVGGTTLVGLGNLRGLMYDSTRLMDFGHPTNPDDLVYVADPATADQIALLDEILTLRMNVPGQGALLNGEVARIIGHPIIASAAMSKTEADGKVSTTAGNNVQGQVVAFNRRAFKIGWRRRVKVETERLPATDQNRIVYSLRMGFGRFTPTANANAIEGASVLYNIDL